MAAVRPAHLLLHRMGCRGRPHHPDGGRVQAHLRHEHLPGITGSAGVLRRVLLARAAGRVHQPAVRIQGRTAHRAVPCRGGRDRVLSGEQDHDVRGFSRRAVRNRRRLFDSRNVGQPVRAFSRTRRNRDPAAQLRAGVQPARHEYRCAACGHIDPAQVGRAGEHGGIVACGGAHDPRRPTGR